MAPWLVSAALAGATLSTDRLAVGLATNGALVDEASGLGLLVDPDGGKAPMPAGSDWLVQGRAFAVWSVAWDGPDGPGTLTGYGGGEGGGVSLEWGPVHDRDGLRSVEGSGTATDLSARVTAGAWMGEGALLLAVTLTPTRDLTGVRVAQVLDPDPDVFLNGDYQTVNTAGGGEAGWATAAGRADGRALALAVAGGAGGVCSWCDHPDEVRDGDQGPTTGDAQVGVAVELGDLVPGEAREVLFVVVVAATEAEARAEAVGLAVDADPDRDGVGEGDCAPFDPRRHPGAEETPNGADDDCDGTEDEGADADGDGWADEVDCDDTRADVHPEAAPVDGVADADCDGVADGEWVVEVPSDEVEEAPGEEIRVDGSGCAVAPRGDGLLGLVALATLAAARRRGGVR